MHAQLKLKIEEILNSFSQKEILVRSKQNSHAYHTPGPGRKGALSFSEAQRAAYLATRLPATHAALLKVFEALVTRMPHYRPDSLLDIGAGPGTALWAALENLPSLEKFSMVERDPGFIVLGKQLMQDHAKKDRCQWIQADISKEFSLVPHDLVIASYSLNELEEEQRAAVVEKLWSCTTQVLILVEPGTPAQYAWLKKVREKLIGSGAHLVAPCPHNQTCPLQAGDWCHFFARLERSQLHQRAKDGKLNYEDEKFSYFIFARQNQNRTQARVLRHPYKGKGFVKLRLCTEQELVERTVTKKEKELYRSARDVQWGDEFPH